MEQLLLVSHALDRPDDRLGPLWAQASTAPSRLYKMFPSQGGILVPAIVKPPTGVFTSNFTPGSFNRSFTTCMDLVPTVLDMIGVSLPRDASDSTGRTVLHRGKPVHRITGYSWLDYFTGGKPRDEIWSIYPADKPIGWELHAQAALRKGPYKIVHMNNRYGGAARQKDDPNGWELFNVEADPGETVDLAEREPAKLAELLADWDLYAEEMGLVWNASALGKPYTKEEAPELWEVDFEMQKTWMDARGGERPNV